MADSTSIEQPFPIFFDKAGKPLDSGYVYIGEYGKNPQTDPIQTFWDEALTQPAVQPIRTINGYYSQNGSPAKLYISGSACSITVLDKNKLLVFSDLKSNGERTQEFETRLGQRILHENLPSSLDASGKFYPQGGCKVGNSLFLKIGNNIGTVGASTEQFIIVEYDFSTGVKLSETAPMETLGHHELSGFTKDGKTYLVTSYQPQVSSNNQSGAGASFIEWKGSATTLDNVTGYKLLNELEYIGYPAVDEKGEYLYIAHTYYGTATHDGFVTGVDINRAPVIRIHAYKVSELNPTYNNPLYTFQVECPAGDGNNLSNAINGFTATSDHVYLAFGAAYGNCEIHKYTTSGDIVERVVTYHARAARPFNEIVTPSLFLYNAEPEGCFVDDGKIYLICAEDWYGLGEIVHYRGKYYMARYTMTGLSPASHTQNWVDLPYVPESFTEYSATTTYQGRNTSIGEFKRSIIEIGLKSPTLSYDLLGANGSNSVPNIVNNMADRVHIYGTLSNGNAMTFGQYNPNRQSFQKNMTLTANELLIYDTRSPTKLNTKAAALQSYQQDTNNMARLRASSTSTTWFDVYGVNHNIDNVPNIPYAYAARIMVDSKESVSFYRDGRLYNRSYNINGVAAKFYTQESETLSIFQGVNTTYLDTSNQYTWLGQTSGGVHGTATIGMNHVNKTLFPPTDGATELGTRELKWGRVATKDLILQPSTTLLPVNNGELVFEATSNTTVTIKLKGTDGVIRSVALTLA